jgi:hypothetical protein
VAEGVGRWQFTPLHESLPQDGLPADAWIGFLQTRSGMLSTRDEVRPFTPEEQRRVLQVGACLTCHAGDSPMMKQAIADFGGALSGRHTSCVVPSWPK